jgi:hypothetical protein
VSILHPFRGRTVGHYTADSNGHRAWMELEPKMEPRRKRQPGTVLLWCAALLLLVLAAAQGYVSWRAQFAFIDAAKHARLPSALEAIGLDTGAVIFALLGLAHARMGRPARIERILNVTCALGSMVMNLLGADLGSPRSVAVYVLPAVLYAACSDRLIATAAIAGGVPETSVWHFLSTALLYGMRAVVAFPSTAKGLRLRLLEATPLPGKPLPITAVITPPEAVGPSPAPRPSTSTNGMSQRSRLHELWSARDDRFGESAARLARELAPEVGMAEGSARNAITAFRKDTS